VEYHVNSAMGVGEIGVQPTANTHIIFDLLTEIRAELSFQISKLRFNS
jgi:hypothetical protein